jgi:hypothetical protein
MRLNRQKNRKHRLDKDAGAVWTRLRPVFLSWRQFADNCSSHETGGQERKYNNPDKQRGIQIYP